MNYTLSPDDGAPPTGIVYVHRNLTEKNSASSGALIATDNLVPSAMEQVRDHSFVAYFSASVLSEIDQPNVRELVSISEVIGDSRRMFRDAEFEDGMQSRLGRLVGLLVSKFGNSAVEEMSKYLASHDTSISWAREVLIALGRCNDAKTRARRCSVLEQYLSSDSLLVRDGALIGISLLGDRCSVPALRVAVSKEQIESHKRDIVTAIEELLSE